MFVEAGIIIDSKKSNGNSQQDDNQQNSIVKEVKIIAISSKVAGW
jgi:hypothetical protein